MANEGAMSSLRMLPNKCINYMIIYFYYLAIVACQWDSILQRKALHIRNLDEINEGNAKKTNNSWYSIHCPIGNLHSKHCLRTLRVEAHHCHWK